MAKSGQAVPAPTGKKRTSCPPHKRSATFQVAKSGQAVRAATGKGDSYGTVTFNFMVHDFTHLDNWRFVAVPLLPETQRTPHKKAPIPIPIHRHPY
ncbi:MAG: hypothetical protein M5U34_00120 [Chloroflexi bacterium]|nr:hypothetical protein [Chloroflexota bacterium]